MPLTVGGGINKTEDIRALLKAGADKVSINTGAVNRPEFVQEAAEMFGSQCIVVAIDAKRAGNRWEVFTHGGKKPHGYRCRRLGRTDGTLPAREKFCSPVWTATAPRRDTT